MKFGLLLALVSSNAFALDCAGVPEGQVFRIDQGGRSLSKAAIQDQDGLGSCFANQSALMLQSVIPGNPNLSYLNLGLYYATDNTLAKKRANGDKLYTLDARESNSSIAGGFSCKTINAALTRQKATGAGVLCKTEDVPLEHSFFKADGGYDSMLQENSLTKASRYMNTYQKTFGFAFEKSEDDGKALQQKREKADQFKAALNRFVKDSGDTYFAKKCGQSDPEKMMTLMENALTRALNDNPQCIGKTLKSSGSLCQSFAQFGMLSAISTSGKSSKVAFIQNSSSRDQLKAALPSMFQTKGGINAFLDSFGNFIKSADKSGASSAEKAAFAKMLTSKISPENMRSLESDYNRIALNKMDDCKSDNVLSYFKDKTSFLEKAKKDVVLCNYSELLNRASDLAASLPEKTFKNMTGFVDFITSKAGLEYDQAMLSLIANDCSPANRISIPENLKCDQVVLGFKPEDFPGNQMSAKTTEVIKQNRTRMMASLQGNSAVGITICSKFWKDPGFDYNTLPTNSKAATCNTAGKHGFHSITTIGYRCKNNKMQYLAQNSWGPNWKENNKDLEIENGKVWLDEDKLFKNLETIDYLTK